MCPLDIEQSWLGQPPPSTPTSSVPTSLSPTWTKSGSSTNAPPAGGGGTRIKRRPLGDALGGTAKLRKRRFAGGVSGEATREEEGFECARGRAFQPIAFDLKFRYIELLVGSPQERPGTQVMGPVAPTTGRACRLKQRTTVSEVVARDAGDALQSFKTLKTFGKGLSCRKSGIHGWGLYTDEAREKGEMLIEYVGEVVSNKVRCPKQTMLPPGLREFGAFGQNTLRAGVPAVLVGGPICFIQSIVQFALIGLLSNLLYSVYCSICLLYSVYCPGPKQGQSGDSRSPVRVYFN